MASGPNEPKSTPRWSTRRPRILLRAHANRWERGVPQWLTELAQRSFDSGSWLHAVPDEGRLRDGDAFVELGPSSG
jgi:hypothetical protein